MSLDTKDWSRWLKGLIGACISGTAGSVGAGAMTMYVAPNEINLGDGIGKLISVMIGTAGLSFVTSLCKYLKDHPMPDDDDEEPRK